MLPLKDNPDIIETKIRSTTTLAQRKDSKSTKLLRSHGMAGMCFNDGKPRWSNDFEQSAKDGEFSPVRSDWKEFYLSGISSPFKVDGKIAGVFNLDCSEKNKFLYPEKIKFLIQLGGDTIALAMQINKFLK